MKKIFDVQIEWDDDWVRYDVLISESTEISDLPPDLCDDDIFFYGISEDRLMSALKTHELLEGEWRVTRFNGYY